MKQSYNPPRILIIEDNPSDVFWLKRALDELKEDYDLELLADGEAALRFVVEHRSGVREPHPCVILLDLNLPKYDGMSVLRAIKQAPVLAHVHVVVWAGFPSPHEEAQVVSMGAFCREKPALFEHCLELAAELLAICKGIAPPERSKRHLA